MNRKILLEYIAIPAVIFFAATAIVYYPSLFEGKSLSQHDILMGEGTSNQLLKYNENNDEQALWITHMFSGMPAFLNGVEYSAGILKHTYQVLRFGLPHPEGITLVSFFSFYILLLSFGVRPAIAIAGALCFGLNGFNIISIMAGHNAKIASVALAPLILAGVRLAFRDRLILGSALTAFGLALNIYINHLQITYYTLLIILFYGLSELIWSVKEKQTADFFKKVAVLLVAVIIAIGANFSKIWSVYEYSQVSTRGKSELTSSNEQKEGLDKSYAFAYSNGIFEPLVMFIPNILGGSSAQELSENSATADALRGAGMQGPQLRQQLQNIPTYWGDQGLTAPYYAGSITLFLFILGLFILKGREKYWLIGIFVLGVMLSWGSTFSSFNYFMFDNLPGYNKFRSVTFTIIMSIVAVNLLGFKAAEKALSNLEDSASNKIILKAVYATGIVLAVLFVASFTLNYRGAVDSNLPDWLVGAVRDDRAGLFRGDVLRALFFTLSVAVLGWLYLKKKISPTLLSVGFIVVILIDITSLSKRFIDSDSFKTAPKSAYFNANEADQFLQNNTNDGDRVLNLANPFNEARTSYYHESLGGYHGAKIKRYQQLIEGCIQNEMSVMINALRAGNRNYGPTPALNMLNTKYFVAGQTANAVIPNPNAWGAAWVPSELQKVSNADDELSETCNLTTRNTAVVNTAKFPAAENYSGGTGSIILQEKGPNEIVYQAEMSNEGLGVFSEIYYANGWKALIDGEEAEIIQVNFVLRAVNLPAGNHEVRFVFEPRSYVAGNPISIIFSILLLIGFVSSLAKEFIIKPKHSHDNK